MLNEYDVYSDIPDSQSLLAADALFYAVYGWDTEKVKRMRLSSVEHWVKLAKKRMTWGSAYKLNSLKVKPERPLWKKFLGIK